MSNQSMFKTYERLWELMESSQFDAFVEIMTEDCYFYADDHSHEGLESINDYFRDVMQRLPDLHHEVASTIAGEHGLAAEVVAKGTMKVRPGRAIPVEIKACDFLWLDGDRISRWHAYTDSAGLNRQLASGGA